MSERYARYRVDSRRCEVWVGCCGALSLLSLTSNERRSLFLDCHTTHHSTVLSYDGMGPSRLHNRIGTCTWLSFSKTKPAVYHEVKSSELIKREIEGRTRTALTIESAQLQAVV